MATKTFKTRIKLKYDALSAWNDFPALKGEMLLGHNGGKVYAQVGTEDNTTNKLPLGIAGVNVDITGYPNSESTITTAQAAIADLNSRINTITSGMVTSFGGKTGAITLDSDSGLSINDNNVLTITKATDTQLGVVKVTTGNGLSLAAGGTIAMAAATDDAAGAMSAAHFTKLEGIAGGAQVNVIEKVQVNGADLTPDNNKAVNITISEGSVNGTIKVNNSDVAVHGLGSAAYTDSDAYATAAQGTKADTALQSISASGDGDFVTTTVSDKGTGTTQTVGVSVTTQTVSNSTAQANGLATAVDVKSYVESKLTGIVGAMVYRGTTTSYPPVTSGATKGDVYVASSAFETYEKGDMFIYNGETWDVVNGENQVTVTSDGALITAGGAAVSVATVDGTEIPVKVQVTGGNATIATVSDGVVTLKAGVAQPGTSGTITQGTGNDITLAKVATTGAANDVSYNPVGDGITSKTNLQEAVEEIERKVKTNQTNITANTNAITTLNGNSEGSVTNTVNTAINALDGSATIATVDGGVVTLKAGVAQAGGEISNSTGSDITLAKVATTGKISDLGQEQSTTADGLTNTVDMIIFDCGSATENTLTETNA